MPQVSLLDPVTYPGAIKAFAKEVCRNDLLNFGRLHFFFPDSRLALDLNTDKTLKARAGQPFDHPTAGNCGFKFCIAVCIALVVWAGA